MLIRQGLSLHHAYILVGDGKALKENLLSVLASVVDGGVEKNPDVWVSSHVVLGVDEARDLARAQTRTGFGDAAMSVPRKFFIVAADTMTLQAQNALLKTLEEPTPHTHFFFILPRVDTLIPTLRSRVMIVYGGGDNQEDEELANSFLKGTLEERFALAKKLTETKKDEPIDRERVRRFLDALEARLAKGKEKNQNTLTALYQVRDYLSDQGSSPKMLLEHLALSC